MKYNKQPADMSIPEMVRTYGITLADGGRIRMGNVYRVERDNALDVIRVRKPKIILFLEGQKAEEERTIAERKAKIEAIEGLKELYAARKAEMDYVDACHRMMDDEYNDGVFPPKKPDVSFAEVAQRCPRAAAYVKAEDWTFAANYAKASAGRKALEAIIDGTDPGEALAAMESEWSDYCHEHIWD